MTETCVICRREHRGSFACGSCIGRLQAEIRQVLDIYSGRRFIGGLATEVEVTRCRLDNLGADPGKAAETRLAWSEEAAEAFFVLQNVLGTWARDLWETWGSGPIPVRDDLQDIARFFLRYPTWLAQHPAIDQLDDELRDCIRVARRVIDRATDNRMFLGRCDLSDHDNGECDRELYAHRSQTEVECPACGAIWQVEERQDWLLVQAEDETATAETLAGLLTRLGVEITPKDIQDAARKGLLTNVGIDSHTKRRRYRVGAVLDALLPARTEAA